MEIMNLANEYGNETSDIAKPEYGYRIGERYVYRRALGSGAGGSVFLAYDNKISKYWAVKRLTGHRGNELEALKKIDHYAFPRIVDVIHQDGADFLVMDYIEGESLDKYRRKHSLSEKEILLFGRKIAEALLYLHTLSPMMIYMDCKPENIIVTPSKDIRLIDLGSVYVCDENAHNIVSGTAFYAPEEIRKRGLHKTEAFDERTDIYSLGMTLYFLLTGSKTQYRDANGKLCVRRQNKNISKTAERIVRRCTSVRKKERYQNMKELVEELKNANRSGPVSWIKKTRAMVKPLIIGMFDYGCKLVLAAGTLLGAYEYQSLGQDKYLVSMFISLMLLLWVSRTQTIYSWENKKDIYRGTGMRIFLAVFIVVVSLSGKSTQAETMQEGLNVTLYDEYGRKLLIKKDCVWDCTDDIELTIPIEEIGQGTSRITIDCEKNGNHKMYSFLCESTHYNVKNE